MKDQVVTISDRIFGAGCSNVWNFVRLATRFAVMVLIVSTLAVHQLGQEAPRDAVLESLTAAQSLYYRAQFTEAFILLEQIEEQLRGDASRKDVFRRLKLLQALTHVALDERSDAAQRFKELLAIEPQLSLDEREYGPKVRTVFDEAKRNALTDRCRESCSQCESAVNAGDLQGAARILESIRAECECARRISALVTDGFVRRGKAAAEVGDFARALQEFLRAQEADPSNPALFEYSARAEVDLQRTLNAAYTEWSRYFQLRDFTRAKTVYERVLLLGGEGHAQTAAQIRAEYARLAESYSKAWSQACVVADPLALDFLRQDVRAIDPSGNFNAQILEQVQSCPQLDCRTVHSNVALAQLRSRVYPWIDDSLRPYKSRIAVKVRIDEKGHVAVVDLDNPGGNRVVSQVVRDAVRQWKFDPALSAGSACVVTEFFIEFEP
jgi:tetratricopeptide (TPR) repeat protein